MKVEIVGGGAAGCIVALSLLASRRGAEIDVTVREREPEAYTTLCGEGIRIATLERFRAFDSKPYLAETFKGAAWHFPGPVTVNVDDPCGTLERCDWIPAMSAEIVRRGGKYVTGEKVTPDRARELAASCDLLVGADGPGSQVAKLVPAHTHVTMLGIQYRVARDGYETDRLQFHTDKRFSSEYSWVFPKGDILNVGLLADGPDPFSRLDAYMAEQGVAGKVVKKEAYPIGFSGRNVQQGNVVLVGDAGGLTNPVTKGGLAAIIHASEVLTDCVERGAIHEYGARIDRHPISSRGFDAAVEVMRRWTNADFEALARHAPRTMTVGAGSAKRRYAWPLATALATNPRKIRDVWRLMDAFGVSREYSW